MSNDAGRLKLVDLLRLLNSTPLGEVIQEHQLKNHRNRAGLRIGGKRIDLVRYVAWLVFERHKPKAASSAPVIDDTALISDAESAAALVAQLPDGNTLPSKQEAAIAALLIARTVVGVAERIGVGRATIHRWLNEPVFRAAYRRARREFMEASTARAQAAAGLAVDTLTNVARSGRRDSDRVRAATMLLEHGYRGLENAEVLHGSINTAPTRDFAMSDVVQLLAARLQQIDQSDLSTAEKARLSATLADALLRAFGIDVLDKRSEALEAVLLGREEKEKKSA